ncbi:uncharacterized protein [Nicotiana tomentosiformis]|uniref:uncharacterized protein n=1 Tax=Nicotiana tomentosiformis TaxID=4098 RepID=UPI00388C44A6
MDVPKKEKSLALRITKGSDLEDDEMSMITKDFKKYLKRGKGPSRSGSYSKPKTPERTKEQVQPKKNKGLTKAMVAAWGESSDESLDDEDGDEQALMAIGESDVESEVSVIHLKDKINYLSKERLSELHLDFIDESEDVNNENEQLSKECVILKAKCKNLERRVSETISENTALKNQVHAFESNVLELRSENLKLKLEISKKTADCTQLILEKNVGKLKDELYKKDEQVQVKENSQIWYMNSVCSKHMTGSKNQFLSLEDLRGENELTYLSVLDNNPLLWNKRLGHASLSQLNKLVSKDLVIGLPNIKFKKDKVCEACAREKQEHDDEEIGLVRNLNETTAQTEAALEEETGDGTGSST